MSEPATQLYPPAIAAKRPEQAFSVKEVCDLLKIGTTKFYAERKAKRLRVCDIGTRSVVFADDLAAYQALLKSEADARPAEIPNQAA